MTEPVTEPPPLPGLDLERLGAYLAARGIWDDGPLNAQLIPGGRSNLTYRVDAGAHRWVLRRPPLGHVLSTAHDMAREYRVMSALAGGAVPVPRMLLLCEDDEVLGAPFYLMEFVDGTAYRRAAQLDAIGPERAERVGLALVDTLVDLHAVDPEAIGLAGFGRPQGFLERQVRRWKAQLDASASREVPGIELLHDRLAGSVPSSGAPTVVHGDYRQDNVLADDADRVSAVLDWEMATLGDPLTDVALLVTYRGSAVSAGTGGLVADVGSAPGYPSACDQVSRYAERSGRDLSQLSWYVALGYFKLAVILEGIHFRFTQGKTVGPGFDRIGEVVAPLVSAGLGILDGGIDGA